MWLIKAVDGVLLPIAAFDRFEHLQVLAHDRHDATVDAETLLVISRIFIELTR